MNALPINRPPGIKATTHQQTY